MATGSQASLFRTRGVRTRAERGSTLVEVLIATAIMGTTVVAIVAGLSSLFSSSGSNRQSTTAGIVARDYAEALQHAVAQPNAWCASQFQIVTLTVTSPNAATETLRMAVRKP